MDVATAHYTDSMGHLFETEALPRIAGRIFALLLVSDGPLTLDALAAALKVSKGSASTDARLLARMGVVERVTVPGDRRDYYQVVPDLVARTVSARLARWKRFSAVVGSARRTVPISSAAVRARLSECETGYAAIISDIARALDRRSRRSRRRRVAGSEHST